MAETVTLPSGLELELEPPKVRRLLDCASHRGLGTRSLAALCVESASVSVHDLSDDDAMFAACWAIERLADDEDGQSLARICVAFHVAPSDRLGIVDRVLAYECDVHLGNTLQQEE